MKTTNKIFTSSLIALITINSSFISSCEKENEVKPEDNFPEVSGYSIVSTNQIKFYNNSSEITEPSENDDFYGQDAQYDGNRMQYSLSSDKLTVYDHVTGLTWTRSNDVNGDGNIDINDDIFYADIDEYVTKRNNESYGGYSDWRLPSMKELYSLMNFQGTDPMSMEATHGIPFIDTDYFIFEYGDTDNGDRIIDAQYFSSNVYTGKIMGNNTGSFGLNLADGRIKCYPNTGNKSAKRVMLCRGNTEYGINEFVDNGDETITDNATGLMWTKNDFGSNSGNCPRSGILWKDALTLAQTKNAENYLGYNDWRLPNAKELQSLVDYSRGPDKTNSAAIDPIFNTTQITNENGQVDYPWFWSSTTHVREDGVGKSGVYITFGRAMGYWLNEWTDVHGAGCQRGDNKAGDFKQYTYISDGYYFAMSPQGDAIRSYNYVRLVRDVK